VSAQIAACATPFVAVDPFFKDANIAVGRTQIVAMEHDRVQMHGKCGGLLFSQLLDGPQGLWAPVGATTLGELIDPEATYDASTGRFFIMGHQYQDPFNGRASFFVAYSAVQDGTSWTVFKFEPPASGFPVYLIDSGNLAVDDLHVWLVAPGNVGPQAEVIVCIKKSDLFASTTPPAYWTNTFELGTNPIFSTFANSFSYDTAPQYVVDFVTTGSPLVSKVRLFSLQLNASNAIVMSEPYEIPVALGESLPGTVPQLAGANIILPGEGSTRFWNAVYRNGSLWATHMVRSPVDPTRCVIRWYEIRMNLWEGVGTPGFPVLRQAGTIEPGGSLSAFMPSIAVDGSENACVTYNTCGPSQRIAIVRSSRCASDPLDEMPTISTSHTSPESLGVVGTSLAWTDYSGTGPDPAISNRFYSHNTAVKSMFVIRSLISRFDGNCGLDMNGDGLFDAGDAASFVSAAIQGAPEADVAASESIDADDAEAFVKMAKPK
jgi:hypothetical protein